MDELELARQQMFQRLSDLEQFYQGGDATNLMAQLQAQASGQNVPYTQNVLANMLADNSGASSAQFRGDQQTINRAFANSGMSGSGLQADAILNARQRSAAMTRAGRRDITTRAELANYQAQERGRMQIQSYLAQQEALKNSVVQQQNDLTSKLHATGDGPDVAQVTGGQAPQQAAPAPAPAPMAAPPPMPTRQIAPTPMLGGDPWGVQGLQIGSSHYAMAQQKYQEDLARQKQLQQSYDLQYQARMAYWLSRYGG